MSRYLKRPLPLSLPSIAGALSLLAVVLIAACGSDPTATSTRVPDATATNIPGLLAPTVPSTSPSVEDLVGGSPELFGAAFQDAIAGSQHRPTSEFAAAAQPLAPGETLKIGFIYVGSRKDMGYNQAVFEGSQWLETHLDNVEIIHAENIPETAEVQGVARQMIDNGAKIIFATSFGYSGPIKEIAPSHPEIIFLHQGDVESLENYGAYLGNIWQLEYAAGQVAGSMTESNKLGFIAAFPIPATLLNVNAFHLGARSVNPEVETTFVLTSDWCDPAKQVTAVQTMIDSGIDVLTQHQDCTKTIVEAAERAGIFVTGYHQDASPAGPNSWLTGAAWNWGPVYAELVEEIRDGTVRIAEGESPSDAELQTMDYLVEGIIGRTQ